MVRTVEEALSAGDELKNAGQLKAALAAYEEVLILDPANISGLAAISIVQHDLGLIPAAIDNYRTYLAKAPLSVEHVVRLSRLLASEGDEAGAWNVIINYVNAGGIDSEVAITSAYLALHIGRADLAHKVTSWLVQKFPDDINLKLASIEIAGLIGDYATVIRVVDEVRIHEPDIKFSSRHVNIPHHRMTQ